MSDDTCRDLVKRFGRLQADRTTIQVMWDAIERFITPYRGRMFYDQRSEHSIDWFNGRDIYDATAVMAHKNLSASIHGSLTSPTLRWFDIRFRDEKLNRSKKATRWIQEVGDIIHYELQDSNFDLEVNKVYQDIVGFGTAIMLLEEAPGPDRQWNGLSFCSVPLKEAYFEEGYNGRIQRFYRKLQWTPAEILSKFGDDVPDKIKRLDQDGNTAKLDVLFCVYPRNQRILKYGEKIAQGRRPWEACYIMLEGVEQIGKKMGFYDMPGFATRWEQTNSSQWGNSPAMLALGDVLTLNQVVKDDLRAKAKAIDPPMLAEERSVITDLNLNPATLSVVRSIAGVQALDTQHGLMASDVTIDRLQNNIRNYFMVDRIDFPDLQPQPMTATEAQIRYERMQRYMGATLAHLRSDLLNPIIERAFGMLAREGRLPDPPEGVSEQDYDIEYLGSLTRAQQVDEVTAIERTMMAAGGLAEVFPDGLDAIDAPEGIRLIGRKLNAPATLMRDEGEVAKRQQEREARQQQMMAAEQAQADGEAMRAMGEGEQAMRGAENGGNQPVA